MTDATRGSDVRHGGGGQTRGWRAAYLALICCTVAVGAVTFTLSFVGLRDYGIRVERLHPWLAPLVPVGVDILSLCGVTATYLLRDAKTRVRAYAWLVFGVAVALSVAGNLTHAVARHLSPAGMVGAAAWPILLALASHLVIVTRRALDRGDDSDTATAAASVPAAVAAPATPVVAPAPADEVVRVPRQPVGDSGARATARGRVAAGESCDTVARALGVSKRSVERWTGDIREVRQRSPLSVAADLVSAPPAEVTTPHRINGHTPALTGRA
jgi:hypothetical protein